MTRLASLVMLLMLAAVAHGAQGGGAVNPVGGNGGGGNNDGGGNGNGNGGNTVTPGGGAVVATANATAGQRPLFGNAGGGSVPAKAPERGADNSRELKKPALPEAVEVKTLDSSKFDRVAPQLKLTTEQSDSIEKAKAQIRADGQKLSAAQDEARAQYTQAANEAAYREASRKVHDSADACRDFRPDVKFECALDKILSEEQARAYRK